MANPVSSLVREGATVPRGTSVAYATTTPTEHFPFNRLCQQSDYWRNCRRQIRCAQRGKTGAYT